MTTQVKVRHKKALYLTKKNEDMNGDSGPKMEKSTSEKFKKRVSMFCFEIIIICCFGLNNVNRGNQSFAKPSFELFSIFLKFCPSVYGHEIKRSAMNKRT